MQNHNRFPVIDVWEKSALSIIPAKKPGQKEYAEMIRKMDNLQKKVKATYYPDASKEDGGNA